MGAISSLGTTFDTNAGNKTVVATPAVSDQIVIFCANSGRTITQVPTVTDNNSSGTYTLIGSCTTTASVDSGWLFLRNALIPSATSTTFTFAPVGAADTGGGLNVCKVIGVSSLGANAVRQQVSRSNIAAATPAATLGAACDPNNVVVGMVINASASPILNPPTGPPAFTEFADTSFTVPAFAIETCGVNGLQTSATVTWASASGTQFGVIVAELNCDIAIFNPVLRSTF